MSQFNSGGFHADERRTKRDNCAGIRGLALSEARLETLYQGHRFGEGPAWFGDGRYLIWSDIPSNRMLRWDEVTGQVGEFRSPSNYSNGNTRDNNGRLVTCEHGGRCISRTEHDGRVVVLVDSYEGARLNSPNDVVVKSDGSIWFTDSDYGIISDWEGNKAESEIGACNVYRLIRARIH